MSAPPSRGPYPLPARPPASSASEPQHKPLAIDFFAGAGNFFGDRRRDGKRYTRLNSYNDAEAFEEEDTHSFDERRDFASYAGSAPVGSTLGAIFTNSASSYVGSGHRQRRKAKKNEVSSIFLGADDSSLPARREGYTSSVQSSFVPVRTQLAPKHRSRSDPGNDQPGGPSSSSAGVRPLAVPGSGAGPAQLVSVEEERPIDVSEESHVPILRDSGFDSSGPPALPRTKSHQPGWTRDFTSNISRRFSQLQDFLLRSKPPPTPYSTITTIDPPPASPANPLPPITPVTTSEFVSIVRSVVDAIARGDHPDLIARGSSGSYVAKGAGGEIVGVFKPRDEEPYGHMNPKWMKWLHRNLFPCCFGRSLLLPNTGFVSEAAASYLDRRIGLNIVPRTEVVSLASPAFHYSPLDRHAFASGRPLPPKMGSFQLFVRGYKDSGSFFREGYEMAAAQTSQPGCPSASATSLVSWSRQGPGYSLVPVEQHGDGKGSLGGEVGTSAANGRAGDAEGGTPAHPLGWSERTQREFQLQFERLVCLDYLCRNTDRGMDNWLIRHIPEVQSPPSLENGSLGDQEGPSAQDMTVGTESGVAGASPGAAEPNIRIAAIDNGLAFPHKHPDFWRSYPWAWSFLPIARVPFSQSTRELVVPLISSEAWWRETFEGLEQLFRLEPGFDEGMFRKQRAVMRGQGYNLLEVLRRSEIADSRENGSPWALVRRPNVSVFEEEVTIDVPGDVPEGVVCFTEPPQPTHEEETQTRRRMRAVRQRFVVLLQQPFFRSC